MVGRLKLTLVASFAAVLIAPAMAHAQEGSRFRVLIPYFEPRDGANKDFGKDASKELRELINTLPTHVAIDEDDIKDEVKQFNMKIEDLNCLLTVQLASQINVPVAVCASYTQGPDRSWIVDASIRTIQDGSEFPLEQFTVERRGEEEAAHIIFTAFDRYNTQVRSAAICQDYAASQQWQEALRNCDASLEINPTAMSVRFPRGRVLYEMERYDEALDEFDTVLEADPFQEDALQMAGYISVVQGDDEAGREYYGRYLELQPGNAAIRMRIAYEMGQAGDPVGAMQLIQVGLDVDPENVDLSDQYGGFAFRAALDAQDEYHNVNPDAEGLAPEAAQYYREAIAAYTKVFDAKGAETPPDRLRNMMAAYIQLEELDQAISLGERALQTHSGEVRLWSLYADALQRSGRLDDAIAALDHVRELNPDDATVALRQGNWLIQAGRLDDAVEILTQVAEAHPDQADQAARMVFAEAYSNGYQKDDFAYAITGMTAAKRIPNISESMTQQLNFWHGYSMHRAAVAEQDPQTLATANATLPKFQEAERLLNQSGDYPASVNVNLQQLLENLGTYVEIQEAIIRRGH